MSYCEADTKDGRVCLSQYRGRNEVCRNEANHAPVPESKVGDDVYERNHYASLPTGTIVQFAPCGMEGCNCGDDYAAKIGKNGWAVSFVDKYPVITDEQITLRIYGSTILQMGRL